MLLFRVDQPLSIAQVTPHRRGDGSRVNEFVERVSEELERRGHGVGSRLRRHGQEAAGLDPLRHRPRPRAVRARVSSTALRHSYSLNVATFHKPQERVLSTQVARPLVEIFFGRLDARTVTTPATGELLEGYFPGTYELVESGGPGRDSGTRSRASSRRSTGAWRPSPRPPGDPEVRARLAAAS